MSIETGFESGGAVASSGGGGGGIVVADKRWCVIEQTVTTTKPAGTTDAFTATSNTPLDSPFLANPTDMFFTVPEGVNFVEVAGVATLQTNTTDLTTSVLIHKNDFQIAGYSIAMDDYMVSCSITTGIIPVVAGDTFKLKIYTQTSRVLYGGGSYVSKLIIREF